MANVDVTRIAGNIGALNSLYSLQNINTKLAFHQARLSTGRRLVEASDDPSGMSIATTFDVRRQGMKTALSAIGDAKNLLATTEGGLKKIQDILVKMRNKSLEATGDTLGASERAAITAQLKAFRDEINDVVSQTEWNGVALLGSDGTASTARTFLTTDNGGTANFSFAAESTSGIQALQGFTSGSAGAVDEAVTASDLALNDAKLDVSSSGSAAMQGIDNALEVVKAAVSQVGSFTARLTFKEESLMVAHANTEAAYNRIMNANMAEEQVEASKLSILQQTATASLAQANVAPQFLLQLFR